MTVKQLIDELNKHPMDAKVRIELDTEGTYFRGEYAYSYTKPIQQTCDDVDLHKNLFTSPVVVLTSRNQD